MHQVIRLFPYSEDTQIAVVRFQKEVVPKIGMVISVEEANYRIAGILFERSPEEIAENVFSCLVSDI